MTASVALDFWKCAAQVEAFGAFQPGATVCNAWGRGTGKSWFARVMSYLLVAQWDGLRRPGAQKPGVRVVYLMPTFRQFKRVGHAQNLLDELGPAGPWGFLRASINQTEWRVTFPGGSWIQVVSAEHDNRGMRCDAVIVDEADDVDESLFHSVMGPWFSEPHSLKQMLVTGTPRRGRYGLLWKAFRVWPHGDSEHEPLPKHFGFHATAYETPLLVSRDELEKQRGRTPPDTFAREWLCDFDSGEGLVYPFFEHGFHVRTPPAFSQFNEFIVGLDHGFRDPTVMLVIGIAGKGRDSICHVVQERYLFEQSITQLVAHARDIESAFPGAKWYADHDPAKNQALRAQPKDAGAGVRLYEADKAGRDAVEAGVGFVADALFIRSDEDGRRWAQLYVDPSCKRTIEEFGLYRRKRDPRDAERVLDEIDSSKNDHCMDALRYALYTHFGGRDRRLVVH